MHAQAPELFLAINANVAGPGTLALLATDADRPVVRLHGIYLEYDAAGTAGAAVTLEDDTAGTVVVAFPTTVAPRYVSLGGVDLPQGNGLLLRNGGAVAIQMRGVLLYTLF